MNSLRFVDTSIRRWETWTISSEISEKILSIMLNVKKSLSSSIRIKTLINRHHAHDLKYLNRVLVRLLNHQKIKWTLSIATIVKNLIIFHVIVVNLKRYISTTSCVKWTYMIRKTYQVKQISSSNRKKSSFRQRRDKERE